MSHSFVSRRGTIVVAGALAQKPTHGGHTWVFLQYLLGFKRLGWDVLFLDRLEPAMCVDADGQPCDIDASINLRYLREVMQRFGLGDAFALLSDHGTRVTGLTRAQLVERVKHAALLLNVMGYLDDEEILSAAPRRVFLDIDPGLGQMWRELGWHDPFLGHEAFVTIGENIGQPDCAIPTCDLDWIATRQPVVLDYWRAHDSPRGKNFTSIASWRGAYGPIEYRGKTYGLRVHEFRKFLALPRLTAQPFELALDIHPDEVNDRAQLALNGWALVNPNEVARDPWAYQAYIQNSQAEFMVAKNLYVETRSGWFSDRSICYLASGKPVLAQDTGVNLPGGEGLLTFANLEEACAGVQAITRDYARQARAAREIAKAYFDSDKVLSSLLSKLGVA